MAKLFSGKRKIILILGSALILGLFFRVISNAQKQTLYFDESISYLAATGNLGSYLKTYAAGFPYGQVVKAPEWQNFLSIKRPFCFRQIGYDLAHYDTHPPLYFWLLHLTILLAGKVDLWTPWVLNVVFDIFTGLFLLKLAISFFQDGVKAAWVVLLWALSPSVIDTTTWARPYSLLALEVVLFVWLASRIVRADEEFKWFGWLGYILVAAAGFLTYYYFSLPVAGLLVYELIQSIKKGHFQKIFKVTVSAVVSVIIFLLFHPQFYLSIPVQRGQSQAVTFNNFVVRVFKMVQGLAGFFAYGTMFMDLMFTVFLSGLMLMIVICVTRARWLRDQLEELLTARSESRFASFLFLWLLGTLVILFLTFISHIPHMMLGRYLSLLYPLYALMLVAVVVRFFRRCDRALVVLSLVLLVASLSRLFENRNKDTLTAIKEADLVVVDTVRSGALPRLFWLMSSEQSLLAARQDYLIRRQSDWLSELNDKDEIIYIHYTLDGNSTEAAGKLVESLGGRYEVAVLPGENWTLGAKVYALKRT